VNNQNDNRFPKAASICLAFLLIIVAVLAGYDENHAAAEAFPEDMPTYSSDELVWVRQDQPIININDDPTAWDATEPRFAGSYGQYTITETEIAYHERWVDHEYEWYDVTIRTKFDRPPLVLNPPLRYKITAAASHSGTHNQGSIGYQFWYSSPYAAVIEPKEVLGYYPFDAWWDGTSSKEWMIDPPAILGEGDSFEISAGWWNCPPCNVMWTYKAEPANAVERLGVEVVQPTVKYQGEEVPPGKTFFPKTCPGTTTQADWPCDAEIEMELWVESEEPEVSEKLANAYFECILDKAPKFLLFLSMVDFREDIIEDLEMKRVIINIVAYKLVDQCDYKESKSDADRLAQADEGQIDLMMDQGAMHLSNMFGGQTISVDTPLGAASTASRGAFLTAYSPDTNTAFFRAYSTPLLLEPKSGSTLVLKSNQEVELTSEGFGPVRELPRVYLPMVK